MADQDNSKATPKAIKDAEIMWGYFLTASKICGAFAIVTLIFLAVVFV